MNAGDRDRWGSISCDRAVDLPDRGMRVYRIDDVDLRIGDAHLPLKSLGWNQLGGGMRIRAALGLCGMNEFCLRWTAL